MKRETNEWLKIALEDLQSAEILFENDIYRMVCYHSQQAIEKFLKTLMVEKEMEIIRTHNIIDLINNLKKEGYDVPINEEDAIFLNSIYRFRYPSDLGLLPRGEPLREDANKALNLAKLVSEWVKKILLL